MATLETFNDPFDVFIRTLPEPESPLSRVPSPHLPWTGPRPCLLVAQAPWSTWR